MRVVLCRGVCACGDMHPTCDGCIASSPSLIKIYTQEVNGVGGALTVDLQLLRNGSMNREQVAMLRAAWDGSDRRCAADYGNSTWCATALPVAGSNACN